MSILCVLTPEIKPVKPGFLLAHKPGFTGLKTGGLPGFSGTRVPGLDSLVVVWVASVSHYTLQTFASLSSSLSSFILLKIAI